MNRLLNAVYQKPNNTVPVTNSYNETLNYDKNGNILNLNRNGEYDDAVVSLQIDRLSYRYSATQPNQLMKVVDDTINPMVLKMAPIPMMIMCMMPTET